MPMTEVASAYLSALSRNGEIEGGLAFSSYIDIKKLDYSIDSLKYIDSLLDAIHAKEKTKYDDAFLSDQSKINFAYMFSFYVGSVIEKATNESVSWYQYKEIIEANPNLSGVLDSGFVSSILCTHGGALFIPLASILTRLTEGPDEKSVWFSADGQIKKINSRAKPVAQNTSGSTPGPKAKPWYKAW